MRATGEFYITSVESSQKFDKSNAHDTINNTAKDANATVGVYYYEHPTKGKVYMRRTGSTNGLAKFTYQELLVYDFDKFPAAIPYEHINFGMWSPLAADNVVMTDLGIAFVNALPGKGMTMSDMPNNGKATYRGSAYATVRQAGAASTTFRGSAAFVMSAETTVDFGKNTIDLALEWPMDNPSTASVGFAKFKDTIDGNIFSGTTISDVVPAGGGFTRSPRYHGKRIRQPVHGAGVPGRLLRPRRGGSRRRLRCHVGEQQAR